MVLRKQVNVWLIVGIALGLFVLVTFVDTILLSPGLSPAIKRDVGGGSLGGTGADGKVDGDVGSGGGGNVSEWIVFVTNQTFSPNFGGLARADFRCNRAAISAGLKGTYVAWLSTSTKDARDRIPDGRYVRVDGVKVADSKADLLDGSLDKAIEVNEYGKLTRGLVYTGTDTDGAVYIIGNVHYTCDDWTSRSADDFGTIGASANSDKNWVESSSGHCDDFSTVDNEHLYCFQTSVSGQGALNVSEGSFVAPDWDNCTQVWTAQDLDNVRNNLEGCYIQMADIDLSGYSNWEPIGTETAPFRGTYFGDDYKIRNLRIVGSGRALGLFGAISKNDAADDSFYSVSHVILVDPRVTADFAQRDSGIGSLVGIVTGRGGILGSSQVWNGQVQVISSDDSGGSTCVGGLVGGTFGLQGFSHIKGSSFHGYVINSNSGGEQKAITVGGLVGCFPVVTDSIALGRVDGFGAEHVGGLVGIEKEDIVFGGVSRSGFMGRVTGGRHMGGLIGSGSLTSDSFSAGFVDSSSVSFVDASSGGLLGEGRNIWQSYSHATVIGAGPNRFTGGLVGHGDYSFVHSYSTGRVTGTQYVGGFAGSLPHYEGPSKYFDIQSSGRSNACGVGDCSDVFGKTTAEMKQQSTYSYWDFNTSWTMVNGKTYPVLREQFMLAQWARWPFDSMYSRDGKQYTEDIMEMQKTDALVHGAEVAPGRVNKSLFFRRAENDYVNTQSDFDLYDSFAISTWVRLQKAPASGEYYVIMSKNKMPSEKSYAMFVNENSKLYFVFYPTADGATEAVVSTVVNATVWNHIAVTYDGDWLSLYVNGVKKSSLEVDGARPADIQSNLILGAQANSNSASGYSDYMWGSIDDVRMYHRPLLDDEITVLAYGFDR